VSLRFHWFLPTSGGEQAPNLGHLAQVARSAEQLGFESVLTPTGAWSEDAWLVTAALISQTQRLKFLVAFRPGLVSPTLTAQMAATYQRISGGRLLLNVVTGGQPGEQARFGDYLLRDERYARAGEFLAIVREAWTGRPVDLSGQHYQVRGATVARPPDPHPGIYFGGSSPAAGPVAARYADVYLTWGEPPAQVAAKLAWMRNLAQAEGRGDAGRLRRLRFGIRLHVITRDTEAEACAEVRRRLSCPDAAEIENAPKIMLRGGPGTALAGSHEQVADLIEEYASLGVEDFVLSGCPRLEEAYQFGEGVLPVLRRRGVVGPQRPRYAV
jgi:alkanesulfonate monooxygenase